jgi:hypothetical protein
MRLSWPQAMLLTVHIVCSVNSAAATPPISAYPRSAAVRLSWLWETCARSYLSGSRRRR